MRRTVQMAQCFIYLVKSIYLQFSYSLTYCWSVHTYMVYMYSDLSTLSICQLLWKRLVIFNSVSSSDYYCFCSDIFRLLYETWPFSSWEIDYESLVSGSVAAAIVGVVTVALSTLLA